MCGLTDDIINKLKLEIKSLSCLVSDLVESVAVMHRKLDEFIAEEDMDEDSDWEDEDTEPDGESRPAKCRSYGPMKPKSNSNTNGKI